MAETKLFKINLSDVKEFLPDKPVTFDPPKMMYVWDDEDANDPDSGAPYLAEVFYVNPGLGVKRVFAHGDGMSAKNMGATWDHCAETPGMGAKAIYAYLHGTKDDAKKFTESTDCMRHEGPIVTYRELSEWLSRGKGQVLIGRMNDAIVPPIYSNTIAYAVGLDNETVPWERTACTGETYYRVRKYGDDKPVAPTRQYMEVPDPGYSSVAVPDSVVYNLGLMPGQCFHAYASNQPDWNAYTKEGRNG